MWKIYTAICRSFAKYKKSKKGGKHIKEREEKPAVYAVVCFPKGEIESVWGKPKLAIQYQYSYIHLNQIDEESLREIMGLRVYARIVGHACGEDREMLAIEFVSGNTDFMNRTMTRTGKHYMEISRSAPNIKGKVEHSRFEPVYRDKPLYLHGFVRGMSAGKMIDEIPDMNNE